MELSVILRKSRGRVAVAGKTKLPKSFLLFFFYGICFSDFTQLGREIKRTPMP